MLSRHTEWESTRLKTVNLVKITPHSVSLRWRALFAGLSKQVLKPLSVPDWCTSLRSCRLEIITKLCTTKSV
jgi:hypothetical protein